MDPGLAWEHPPNVIVSVRISIFNKENATIVMTMKGFIQGNRLGHLRQASIGGWWIEVPAKGQNPNPMNDPKIGWKRSDPFPCASGSMRWQTRMTDREPGNGKRGCKGNRFVDKSHKK